MTMVAGGAGQEEEEEGGVLRLDWKGMKRGGGGGGGVVGGRGGGAPVGTGWNVSGKGEEEGENDMDSPCDQRQRSSLSRAGAGG